MQNLTSVSPFFIVENLKKSVSFYTDKLGFEILHIGPDDLFYFAIVGRDNISIMLKQVSTEVKPCPNHSRDEWARWDAYISTTEPDTLFAEYSLNDIGFRQPIQDDSDGLRGFEIADLDGYVLFFGRPKS